MPLLAVVIILSLAVFGLVCIVGYILHKLYTERHEARRTLTESEIAEHLRPVAQVHRNGGSHVSD
jgi:hypothetical protein